MPFLTAGGALAAVGAVASVGSSLIQSGAASDAASKQAAASDRASQAAIAQAERTRADLAPFRAGGGLAMNRLLDILKLSDTAAAPAATTGQLPAGWTVTEASGETPGNVMNEKGEFVVSLPITVPRELAGAFLAGAGLLPAAPAQEQPVARTSTGNPLLDYGLTGLTFRPDQATLEATPGYQFTRSQGLKAVQSSNAAKGLGVSGAALKGAAKFATGLADNTLGTQQAIFQTNLGNVMNPLMSLTTMGQNAAAQTGSLGNAAVGSSNAALLGGANAQASGIIGGANALSGGLTGATGNLQNAYYMNKLLDTSGGSSGGSASFVMPGLAQPFD